MTHSRKTFSPDNCHSILSIRVRRSIPSVPRQYCSRFPQPARYRVACPIFSDFLDSDVFAVDPKLRTPYVQNFNLDLQRELFKDGVFEVGYVGSHGTKLFRYRDIDQQANPSVSSARPFDNGPFAPSGGTFFYVNHLETTANSSYNALQTSFTLRNRRGWIAAINYTWSHSIDNASDGQDYVANATQPDNSYRADLRTRQLRTLITGIASWSRPVTVFQTSRRPIPRLGDGWQLNTVVTVRSGNPFHLTLFDDYNDAGEFFPRPEYRWGILSRGTQGSRPLHQLICVQGALHS